MEDKQAIMLTKLAADLAAKIPETMPIKILQYQAKRLLDLPHNEQTFNGTDLIIVVATLFPVIYCLRKIFSWDQIKQFINSIEKGEQKLNETRDDYEQTGSTNSSKPS